MVKYFTETFRQELEQDKMSNIEQIESRSCESDRFSGVSYRIYGNVVSTQPIIRTISKAEGYAIQNLYHCTDAEEPYLAVFVATLPSPTRGHPAFV